METSMRRGRGRPRDEALQTQREEEILDVATKLFAQRGFAETDVESVAELLGLGKGTIYRYFPSKRELFLAAVDRGMTRLDLAINTRVALVEDPLERIVTAIYAFLEYFSQHPELVELFVQERAHFKDRQKPAYFAHHDAKVGPWREMYQSLVQAGRVRDIPEPDDITVVNDLLYGTILANRFANRTTSHLTQARTLVDIVFHGILSDSERQRRLAQPDAAVLAASDVPASLTP